MHNKPLNFNAALEAAQNHRPFRAYAYAGKAKDMPRLIDSLPVYRAFMAARIAIARSYEHTAL